jgi:NADH-quinone oxidoreductase subunit E
MAGNPRELKLSDQAAKRIDWYLFRYPSRQAAVLPALHLAQAEFGHLSTEVMDLIAVRLGVPPVQVYEAATFYSLYQKKPMGRHCVYVCTNIGCFLKGADALLSHLKKKLGIECGETTSDGKFSLFSVECLANCGEAPAVQIDDEYHNRVTPGSMDRTLDELP